MKTIGLAAMLCAILPAQRAPADPPAAPAVVRAMKDELARSMDKLELTGFGKPYYLAYGLNDGSYAAAFATLGAVTGSSAEPMRMVDIDLRVGDYQLDNSNFAARGDFSRIVHLGVDDDYDAARRELWLATDAAYKAAGEALEHKRAVIKAEAKDPDEVDSFSKDTPATSFVVAPRTQPDRARLEALAKKLSAAFRGNRDVYRSSVSVTEKQGTRYFVSSEGAYAAQPYHDVSISVSCATQADDGMPLHDEITFTAASLDQLPSEAEMLHQIEALSRGLTELRKAPIVDDYAGPVLFRGAAAAQVVRALLAEDFVGTPAPKSDRPGARGMGESELITKVGQRILPVGVSIVDDAKGQYAFDDQGIAPQRVSLVENGVFKRFLMSRTPRKGFEHSTGHSRSSSFSPARASPANLIVSSSKGVSDRELSRRAMAIAKEQELPFVLAVDRLVSPGIDELRGGFGGSAVGMPVVLKRVYPSGREELVRGGSIGSIPLQAFKDLVAIGATGVPYRYALGRAGAFSIVCPALLFRDVDVKKPRGAQKKPPIAPRP